MENRNRPSHVLNAIVIALFLISSIIISTPVSQADPNKVWSAQTYFHIRKQATTSPTGYAPDIIKGFYNLPDGGSGTIAIIDAYDCPTVQNDLDVFSTLYGLPLTGTGYFTKVKIGAPSADAGWALEISLDVQWAHAMAPSAKVLLVEANSASLNDLLAAVDYAKAQPDVVAISMSWGASEFLGETTYDSHFTSTNGVSFFASSGDSGAGVIWPSASPNVIAVGGTTLKRNTDLSISETGWSGSGGGVSAYESKPTYQSSISYSKRAVPDVSYDADPATGVSVYDSTPYSGQTGWFQVGGTSAGAPQWAAIQALGKTATNANFYADAQGSGYPSYFRDVTTGSNGKYSASTGYDLVTGLGSPVTTHFTSVVVPDFTISASPSTLTITAGGSGTSTITVTAVNGFLESVSLSANWASFSPPSLTNGVSTMTITVLANTASGTYPITVVGTSGTTMHSTMVNVKVLAPLTVTLQTDKSSYIRGQTVTVRVNVRSNGVPVQSATVKVSITPPGSSTSTYSASTDSSGNAVISYKLNSRAQRGTYKVTATASKTGYQAVTSNQITFTVS